MSCVLRCSVHALFCVRQSVIIISVARSKSLRDQEASGRPLAHDGALSLGSFTLATPPGGVGRSSVSEGLGQAVGMGLDSLHAVSPDAGHDWSREWTVTHDVIGGLGLFI